ncbi:CHAT domain-containing protein [Microbacterium xanthum]|uniref:CHAT domain-containing protein n=1 Tax=Microbacterium xanthum TaxID=3079794 RepID=UPI002AD25CA0|nr:CHAT domain-containing protein [Microbacterium sp. KSW-48]MDZ8171605.1 CHAT domain-containing protein [Microbacterium sp. KSW-48]
MRGVGPDAIQLHQRAVAQCIDGRYATAQRTLDRAAGLTSDPDLIARIDGTRAMALQRTGRPDAAEALLHDTLARPGLSAHTESILLGQLGGLANYGGRLDEGERWLGQAIQRLSDDDVAASRIRMNRSLVRMQQRRLLDAAEDLKTAVSVFAAHGLVTDAAQARHNLGYTALLEGDLVRALREMNEARDDAANSPVAEAIGAMDRAEVFRDAGLATEAEDLFRQAAAIFGAHRMPQSRAEAEFHLSRSLLAHDGAASARVAGDATRRFRALGNDAWAARAEGVRLRAVLGASRVGTGVVRRTASPADADRVAASLASHGFRSEAAAVRIAAALAAARAGDATGPAPRVPASAPMEVRLLGDELKAARAAARRRGAEARRHAAAGLDRLAAWQSSFGSIDLQTSVAMHGANLVFTGLQSAAESRRPDIVFEWSERARHLSQQVVPLRPPPDPEMAEALAELRMLRAENPAADWLSDPRAAPLRDRAREHQWTSVGTSRIDERVDLSTLGDGLDPDTALLAYVFTGEEIIALVVDGTRSEIVGLGDDAAVRDLQKGLRADLDVAASVRTGPMAAVVRRSLDARLAALSAALLDEPLRRTAARRLVITAPGLLNAIPWSMLPGMRGRVFTLAASASQWLHRRGSASAGTATRAGFAVGPRVARGGEEARLGASAWRHAPVVGDGDATVSRVTRLAADVDVLHIAAHGRHAVDNPLFSGLELSDGALFGYDVDLIPDVPRTVVLSACEVGRSSVRWGEEAVGMARVWLHAGSITVIAAPVVVADDLACELLGSMHAELAAGLAPAEALAVAADRLDVTSPFQAHGAGF